MFTGFFFIDILNFTEVSHVIGTCLKFDGLQKLCEFVFIGG